MKKVLLAVLILALFYSSAVAIEMVRQKGIATYIYFPIVDADGDFVESAAGLDSEIDAWGDGSPPDGWVDCTNEATEIGGGWYYLSLTTSEMNVDYIAIKCSTTTAGAKKQAILIRTTVGDPLNLATTSDGGTITLPTNFSSFALTGAGAVTVGTNSDKTGYGLADDAITAAKIAGDAIGASELAATAATEITDDWETQSQADPTGFHVNVMEIESGDATDAITAAVTGTPVTLQDDSLHTLMADVDEVRTATDALLDDSLGANKQAIAALVDDSLGSAKNSILSLLPGVSTVTLALLDDSLGGVKNAALVTLDDSLGNTKNVTIGTNTVTLTLLDDSLGIVKNIATVLLDDSLGNTKNVTIGTNTAVIALLDDSLGIVKNVATLLLDDSLGNTKNLMPGISTATLALLDDSLGANKQAIAVLLDDSLGQLKATEDWITAMLDDSLGNAKNLIVTTNTAVLALLDDSLGAVKNAALVILDDSLGSAKNTILAGVPLSAAALKAIADSIWFADTTQYTGDDTIMAYYNVHTTAVISAGDMKGIADSIWLADTSQYSGDDDSTMAGIAWRNKNLHDSQGNWVTATGFAVSGDPMTLQDDSLATLMADVDSAVGAIADANKINFKHTFGDTLYDLAVDGDSITLAINDVNKANFKYAGGADSVRAYLARGDSTKLAVLTDSVLNALVDANKAHFKYGGGADSIRAYLATHDSTLLEIAASCGSGIGLRTINIYTKNAADSAAISCFTVEVYDSSSGEAQGGKQTDNNGLATFSLDDDTYTIHLKKTPWTLTSPQYLTVTADDDTTYYATAFAPGSPASASMCRIYINDVRNLQGGEVAGCKLLAEIPSKYQPVTLGEAIRIPARVGATSDNSGYVYLDVYRSTDLTAGDGTSTVKYILYFQDASGTTRAMKEEVEIPDQATWEIECR